MSVNILPRKTEDFWINRSRMDFATKVFILHSILGRGSCLNESFVLRNESSDKVAAAVHEILNNFLKLERTNINIIAGYKDKYLDDVFDKITLNFNSSRKISVESLDKLVVMNQVRRYAAIIILDSFENFQNLLQMFKVRNEFDRSGYFLIVFPNATEDQLQIIFDLFWKIFVFNIGVISDDNSNFLKLSTFLPFENRCNDTTSLVINHFD